MMDINSNHDNYWIHFFMATFFISSYKRDQEEEKQVNVDKDQVQDVNQLYWIQLQRVSFRHGWIDLPVVDAAAQTSRLAFLVLSSVLHACE